MNVELTELHTSAFALRPTGSADDGPDWQPHIRSKDKRRKLANRFKDAKDPFRTAPMDAAEASNPTLQGFQRVGGLGVEADFGMRSVLMHDVDQLLE